MSEIAKLYENAGISPDCRARECGLDYCPNNYGCGYAVYPDFTPAKQLELIKWLIQEVDNLQLWHFSGKGEAFDFDLGIINAKGATFEETLASLINTLWQDLTPEEKEQIKEILK